MNLYLKIKWRTALLMGILLILTGVVGMFVPLVPEIAVLLLGIWLLGAAAVTPFRRWRLHQQEEQNITNDGDMSTSQERSPLNLTYFGWYQR